MKSFVALSALTAAVVVRAQSSPLIPSGISSGCQTFLESLNSNSTINSCISPIVNATSAFGPYSESNATYSTSDMNTALKTICSTSTCSATAIRSQLTSFYSACTDELTGSSPNKDVIRMYDVLYTITPLFSAVCSKDDAGSYCVTQVEAIPSSASASASSASSSAAAKRDVTPELILNTKRAEVTQNVTAVLTPNTTAYGSTNLPFLFLTSSLSYNDLCTSCTRNILTAYISFEQTMPYALGIAQSPMLGGQSDLYNAVTSTCGSSFMTGSVSAAGGLSGGIVNTGSNGAERFSPETSLYSAAAGAIVLGLASLL